MSKYVAVAGLAGVLGLLALPAAAVEEVRVYGRATVELAQYSDQSDVGAGRDGMTMEDNTSGRIGIEAREEMGGDWFGLARFEFQLDTSDGTRDGSCTTSQVDPGTGTTHNHACERQTVLSPRENMVGLSGKYGELNFGRIKNPYKYLAGVTYDPFTDTALQARGNGGMSGYADNGDFGHDGFLSQSLSWRFSKDWQTQRLALWLAYNPVDDAGAATTGGIKYGTENWELVYAGYDQGDLVYDPTEVTHQGGKGTKYAGSLSFGGTRLKLQYEALRSGGTKDKVVFGGLQYQTGNTILVAQGGRSDGDNYLKEQRYMAFGVIRKFTKQTRMFLGWRQVADIESVFSLGLRKDF